MTTESLWLDSSIIRLGGTKLRELAELAQVKGIQVVVPAHIHLEVCRYLRETKREKYSQPKIDSLLHQLRIIIQDFHLTRTMAEQWSRLLHERYPTSDLWKAAKLSTVRARMGDESISVDEKKIPMTTDWWVALEAEHRNVYIAVGDKGDEWKFLRQMQPCRALSYEEAMEWLKEQGGAK